MHTPSHQPSPSPSAKGLSKGSSRGFLLPPPELPTPNADEVARFQSLFSNRFGVELSQADAHDQARRLVQFVFLMQHALPHLKEFRHKESQAQQDAGTKPSRP